MNVDEDIALFVLGVREYLYCWYNNGGNNNPPGRFTHGLQSSNRVLFLDRLPLLYFDEIRVNSLVSGITFYSMVWNSSQQMRRALPHILEFMAKHLPQVEVVMDKPLDHVTRTLSGIELYHRTSNVTQEQERLEFSQFVDRGYTDRQLFRTTRSGFLLQSYVVDDRANLCEITETKIIASKHRAAHLTDLLEAFAKRENLPLIWKASVKRKAGDVVLFKHWPNNPLRDDSELFKQIKFIAKGLSLNEEVERRTEEAREGMSSELYRGIMMPPIRW